MYATICCDAFLNTWRWLKPIVRKIARSNVRGVAALGVSPTTLYKYGFNREINAPEQRQRECGPLSGKEIERRSFHDQVHGLSAELEKERERNKAFVARIAIMEANAARLGFDPEEMYKPILKPIRTTSRAGTKVGRRPPVSRS